MDSEAAGKGRGISRRSFLAGAGAGLAAGIPLAWLAQQGLRNLQSPSLASQFNGRSVEDKSPGFGMPGRFPGRVIEVRDPGSVRADYSIVADAVKKMMDRGMCELTGADHATEAWRSFFQPDDRVGIKVNPVGMQGDRRDVVGAISSPAVLLEIVAGLKSAGVSPRHIIVFERYAREFRRAGYEAVMRERAMDGIRWYASSADGGNLQVDIEGYDGERDLDPHVVGYDPDVFVQMNFAHPQHDPRDDRRLRSHLSVIVTRMVDKVITIPVLKDHRSAGVTMALKNLSHGFSNNVARSHIDSIYRLDHFRTGPNQCNTFIPTAAAQMPLRAKATLHILDGLIGVYEGGPGTWNRTWATWPYKALFFATDPVAMDHVGWDIIDGKRVQEGWLPVAKMGLMQDAPPDVQLMLARKVAALAGAGSIDSNSLSKAAQRYLDGRETEVFDRRTPEHIYLAGTVGLGVFDAERIEHRRIELPA